MTNMATGRATVFNNNVSKQGFTIVELLIVIVVIAVLAAITIVAYNGIQNRAKASSAQSAASQATKKVMSYATLNSDQYPADLATAGVTDSGNTTFQYSVNNAVSPRTYCVTATTSNASYYTSSTQSSPVAGGCSGHSANGVSAITNLVLNPSFEANTTNWSAAGTGVTTVSRVTTEAYSGTASYQAIADGTVSNQGAFTSGRSTISPNLQYTASVWVKGDAGKVLRLELGELTSAGALISRTNGANVTGNGSWQQLTATRLMGATAGQADLVIRNNAAVTNTLYVDAAMISEGTNVYNYGDGFSSGWVWNGTVNNSSSTGLPL